MEGSARLGLAGDRGLEGEEVAEEGGEEEGVEAGGDVVEHDAGAVGEAFELADRGVA